MIIFSVVGRCYAVQVRDALAIEAGGILRIDNSRVAHYQLPPSLRFLSIAIAAIEDALRESGYHAMWQTNHGKSRHACRSNCTQFA